MFWLRQVSDYARAARLAPETDEALVLEAIRRARFSIISSVRRHTVAGLIVKDLFRGFEFWLVDEGLESSLPDCRYSLPAAWLERHHCLRLARHAPKLKPMASRDRGHPLYAWHALSCFAALALSQRDLARFCAGRGKLPLFGGPRLFAVGLILVMPAALRSSSESN